MATDFLRAIWHDDALALVIIDLLEASEALHEHVMAVQCNADVRRVRSMLYEMSKAKVVKSPSEGMWSLNHAREEDGRAAILNDIFRMRASLVSDDNDAENYQCKSCAAKHTALELMSQLVQSPDRLVCPTCGGELEEENACSIANEIDEVEKRLTG